MATSPDHVGLLVTTREGKDLGTCKETTNQDEESGSTDLYSHLAIHAIGGDIIRHHRPMTCFSFSSIPTLSEPRESSEMLLIKRDFSCYRNAYSQKNWKIQVNSKKRKTNKQTPIIPAVNDNHY